jgi:nicotinate-nucleotide adenylyltransferase
VAVAGHEQFKLSQIELQRRGPNYSAVTLAELKRQRPADEIFFLIGADSLADMPHWYEPARVVELATLVVAARPGERWSDLEELRNALEQQTGRNVNCHFVNIPLIGISSTDIRQRCRAGKSIRFMVPAAVECYIREHGLYR